MQMARLHAFVDGVCTRRACKMQTPLPAAWSIDSFAAVDAAVWKVVEKDTLWRGPYVAKKDQQRFPCCCSPHYPCRSCRQRAPWTFKNACRR